MGDSLWYLFIIVGLFFALLIIKSIRTEHKQTRADILEFNPWVTLLKIILVQGSYYFFVTLILCTFNATIGEPLKATQVFHSDEQNFITNRGLITTFSHVLAAFVQAFFLVIAIGDSRRTYDFIMTWFFFHFVIVSCVDQKFPDSDAWWFSSLFALFCTGILYYFVGFKFETMAYESGLAGGGKDESSESEYEEISDGAIELEEKKLTKKQLKEIKKAEKKSKSKEPNKALDSLFDI
ncbi:sys1 [Anaeramoeba flamelloides]|uniref:Sys1 n=1 Tax=Anaeramoeba flamelloides TaxID=1746091 RepID=A0ABQ8XQN9_9EUKA|nr:sys1 [Anaeramoeba flamelloides]